MKTAIIVIGILTLVSCNSQVKQVITNKGQDMKTIIVDVRTVEEWNEGHAVCSVNYPLDQIINKADELKQYDKVVLVCRSGARAGNAKMQLESLGVKNIENLGAWQNVSCD